MRILQIAHSFPSQNMAGTEIYAYNLCKELSKKHEVFVFYRTSDLKEKEYDLKDDKFNGLNIATINNTFRFCDSFEKFYRNDAIAEQFARALDKIKPDIIHIQHLIFLSTTIISEIKKRGIPTVFTLHDYWLICPQWHFLRKNLDPCKNTDMSQCIDCLDYQLSIKRISKSIYLKIRNIMPGFVVRVLKNIYLNLIKYNSNSQEMLDKIKLRTGHVKELCSSVDLFIAPSRFLKRKFIEFGIPEDKIEFIPYGLNTEPFKDFRRGKNDRIKFGFIGTMLPAKGVDVLISAFNRIESKEAELRIYGKLFPYKGFEYYPKYIKRMVRNGNIRFMGGFDHKDISSIFSDIDVLVFPSIWEENCPLTILEAFSAGAVVIASRIGGIPELVNDGVDGLLFNPRDADDLHKKMQYIIDNRGIIQKLKNNIPLVKNIETNAKEMEEIYSRFINERKN